MDYDSIVVPQAGKEKETARLLLDLANRQRHVRTNSDGPGMTFVVPAYLAKKYHQSGETPLTGVKRRGRPPGAKNKTRAAGANDTDGETQAAAGANDTDGED